MDNANNIKSGITKSRGGYYRVWATYCGSTGSLSTIAQARAVRGSIKAAGGNVDAVRAIIRAAA